MEINIETSKLMIATELLDCGLRLYFEGNSYFGSLHLAGAAEEILGVYITHHGGDSALKGMLDGAVRLSKYTDDSGIPSNPNDIYNFIKLPQNSTKHMNDLNDSAVSFDAKSEAEAILNRAISNYYHLMAHSVFDLKETDLIARFNNRQIE